MSHGPTKQVKVPDYEPSERQTQFHIARADEKIYGGAAGGGKTAALAAEAITLALEHPGLPIDCFRRTIPEVEATFYVEIMRQMAAYIEAGHAYYKGDKRRFVFKNGSVIRLNYCDNDADVYRYQGREMPVIIIDELTQFPQSWIEYLKTRNRTANEDWPVMFLAATNPGGIGHGYVKRKYIDVTPPNTLYVDPISGITQIFIPAKLTDHVSEAFKRSYGRQLDAISDIQLRGALRDGDWDTFAGQVFIEWSYDKHVVEPFTIPDHWTRWRSMDYGNHNTTLWHAADPQTDHEYVYREYRTDVFLPIKDKAKHTLMLEQGETVAFGFADPAIWKGAADHNTGKTVAQLYEENGVKWIAANNDRPAGLAIVHDSFAIMPDGIAKTRFFSTCLNSIRTIPALPYDPIKTDDVDTKADDHDYDAYRYGKMGSRKATKPPTGGRVIRTGTMAALPNVVTLPNGSQQFTATPKNVDPRKQYAQYHKLRNRAAR